LKKLTIKRNEEYIDPQIAEIYAKGELTIEDLFLSTRAYNCLIENNIIIVNDIKEMPDEDLLSISRLGKGSLKEIREKVNAIDRNSQKLLNDQGMGDTHFLLSHFETIPDHVKQRKLKPYIIAYTDNIHSLEVLNRYFGVLEYVSDIEKVIKEFECDEKEMLVVKSFVRYLSVDVNDMVSDALEKIAGTERCMYILQSRSQGRPLEDVGRDSGITRERVRQLEEIMFKGFVQCDKRKRFLNLFAAISDNTDIALENVITNMVDDSIVDIFIYLLKSTLKPHQSYNKKYGLFSMTGDFSYINIEKYMSEALPYFKSDELYEVVEETSKELEIPALLVEKVIEKNYTCFDTVYCNNQMSLADKYEVVMKKYYPLGIKVSDEEEMEIFRRRITDIFGNIKLPQSNKAVEARIVEITVLCDRSTYIHPDYIYIPDDLVQRIEEFIDESDRVALSYLEVFEAFKEELLARSNIGNRYFLQGFLKYKLKNKYYFTKDLISKDRGIDFAYELKEFIRKNGEVTKKDLKSYFMGTSDSMMAQTMARCKDIITIDYNTYMHSDRLNITQEDYINLREKLDELIKGIPVSCRKVYGVIRKESAFADFIKRNSITNYSKLYGILKYMFEEEYEFSRPNIGAKGTNDACNYTIVKRYLRDKQEIKINELFEFCEDNQIKIVKKAKLISRLSDEFLRSDVNKLVHVSKLGLTEDKLTAIKLEVLNILEEKKYMALIGIKDFSAFPDLGVEWTPFLLISIVQNYMQYINIVEIPTRNFNLPNCIFVKSDNPYADDYKEIVRWIIKLQHEQKPFKSLVEVRNWLKKEGVILNGIPIYLTARKLLYMDERGKVVIR
jgi:hypothetical protein